jgi:hypothetical protein
VYIHASPHTDSPWSKARRYQLTAKRSHEKKKEVAKEKRVQDQGRSIIEVKKSFRYLHLGFQYRPGLAA